MVCRPIVVLLLMQFSDNHSLSVLTLPLTCRAAVDCSASCFPCFMAGLIDKPFSWLLFVICLLYISNHCIVESTSTNIS